jgi:hypothetical protein
MTNPSEKESSIAPTAFKLTVNRKTGESTAYLPSDEVMIQTPFTPAPPSSISSSQRTPEGAFNISETSSTRNRRIEGLNQQYEEEGAALALERPYDGLNRMELERYAVAIDTSTDDALKNLRILLTRRGINQNSAAQVKAKAATDILARAERAAKKKSNKKI